MFCAMHRAAFALLIIAGVGCAAPSAVAQNIERKAQVEDVRINSEPGVILAATLEKPIGSENKPVPVAIIIAGTGSWTRGGFANIRSGLLAHGIATLEYDKRGQGQSTGAFLDTIPATEQDVAAVVAFLRGRRDIDPERIALVGQSQGAVAAPIVASRDPAIAAVVMLSGPVGPRGELFLTILRANLASGGKSGTEIDQIAEAVGGWMDARSRRAGKEEIAQLRAIAVDSFSAAGFTKQQAERAVIPLDTPVVLSMFEAAPDRALAALRLPVLVIYGSEDSIIAPALSFSAAQSALGGNPDALVVSVPGMTHELTRAAPEGDVQEPTTGDRTLPVVVDTVTHWLARRLVVDTPAAAVGR